MPDVSTVGDLMDWLGGQPRDRIVVMSSDAEGNRYSPLADAEECMYLADSTWSGETFMTPEQQAGLDNPDDYDWAPDDAVRAVVLGPIN